MCMPALALAGAAVTAVGSIMGGAAQSAGLKASAKYNERQAIMEQEKGVYEAGLKKDEGQRILSKQRTGFARMGIVGTTGSAADVAADQTYSTNLDVAAIKYGAAVKASNYRYQAKLDRFNAKNAMAGGIIGGIAPLINAAGTSFNSSYQQA